MADRLYRSPEDKMLAGVAGGLAQRLDADPSIVRVIWAVAVFVTGGLALIVYIVMAVVVPYPPEGYVWPSGATSTGGSGAGFGAGSRAPGSSSAFVARARHGDRDRNPAGLLLGLLLVVVGAIFLVRELLPDIDLSISWPILALVVGAALVALSIRPRRSS